MNKTIHKRYNDGLHVRTMSSSLDDAYDEYVQPGSCIVVIDENEQELR